MGKLIFPAGIYLIKVNNRNTRTRCKICSKLTIQTTERRQRRSVVFIVNFTPCSSVSIVNFEHAITGKIGLGAAKWLLSKSVQAFQTGTLKLLTGNLQSL